MASILFIKDTCKFYPQVALSTFPVQIFLAAVHSLQASSGANMTSSKPDRKLGFFELNVTMRDELLAERFSKRLLKSAIDFFIETRTRRLATNVARLQGKADTLERVLNRKTYSAAASGKLLLDLNPVYTAPDAVAEISSRDKAVQSAIYAEVMKNLEISRTALIQETPTVQVVDEPELPLKANKIVWALAVLAGMIAGTFAGLLATFIFKLK